MLMFIDLIRVVSTYLIISQSAFWFTSLVAPIFRCPD